jgi:hypothetical protein
MDGLGGRPNRGTSWGGVQRRDSHPPPPRRGFWRTEGRPPRLRFP